MSDYRRIVDDLQSILYSVTSPTPQVLRRLVDEYRSACDLANERFSLRSDLLRGGLRSEAIQLGEIEPNLLDLMATLDFPELPQLMDLLAFQGLDGPPQLLLEAAADLNAAYAQELPLAVLLRNHRLLALDRAPLPLRIETLRQIHRLDATNSAWEGDLRKYEQARISEIERECPVAEKAGDLESLTALRNELLGGEWLAAPSPGVTPRVTAAYTKVLRERAGRELDRLAAELNVAHNNFDVEHAHTLRDRWQEQAALASLPSSSPRILAAAGALSWLNEQDQHAADAQRYQEAVDNVELEIQTAKTASRLQRAWRGAQDSGEALPGDLAERYEARLRALRRRELLKSLLLGAGAVLFACLLGAGVWYGLQVRAFRSAVNGHRAELERLIAATDIEHAQSYVEKLQRDAPAVVADGRMATAMASYNTMLSAEENRSQQLAALLAEARQSLATPNDDLLAQIDGLIRLSSESAARDRIAADISAARTAARGAAVAQAEAQLGELKSELANLTSAVGSSEPTAELAALAARRAALHAELDGLGVALSRRSTAIEQQVDQLQLRIAQRVRERELQAAITAAVGNPDDFAAALRAYADEVPASTRTKHFAAAAQNAAVWRAIEAWNQLADEWQDEAKAALTPAAADAWSEKLDSAAAALAALPAAKTAAQLRPHLAAIAARENVRTGIPIRNLRAFLTSPDMVKHRIVTIQGGEFFTNQEQPEEYRIFKVSRPGVGEVALRPDDVASWNEMPQTVLASKLLRKLPELTDGNWEEIFYRALLDVRATKDIDPVGHYLIVRQVLKVGCAGSHSMQLAFGELLAALDTAGVDLAIQWTNADDPALPRARQLVASLNLADRLELLSTNGKAVNAHRLAFRELALDKLAWRGWLLRSADGGWEVCGATGDGKDETVRAMWLYEPDRPERSALSRLEGALENGRVRFARPTTDLMEGLPVFAPAPHSSDAADAP